MMLRAGFQHLQTVERKRISMPQNNVLMRLNRGELPEPWDLQTEIFLADAWRDKDVPRLQQYPDYNFFYDRLAKFVGFPRNQICVGAGIEEFIRTLPLLCCEPKTECFGVLWPTCMMYEIYSRAWNIPLLKIPTGAGMESHAEYIVRYIEATPNMRLLFIPNPGQPVETCFSVADLRIIAEECKKRDIVLAVDEAHFGFGAPTALPLIDDFDNVLVLRTFSKMFGAASIRVGFAVGQEYLIKALHAVRPSGEITGPSITAALALMDNYPVVKIRAQETAQARKWLVGKINEDGEETGLIAYGEFGFSVLIDCVSTTRMRAIEDHLKSHGILVKAGFGERLDRHILLACGSIGLMERFYDRFSQVYELKAA